MASLTAVEAIFQAALEKGSAEERAAYLDQACQGDSDLRRQVERLLNAQHQLGSFLEQPAAAEGATSEIAPGQWIDPANPPHLSEGPGTRIGPYKLLQQVGEGGMGVVYMAEQQEPVRRKVALKIIKPGMDSRQVIARFEAERQALALMDHQNIARVLDAGTTETGRPYFVMELVKGVPITKFCDEQHLTPRERLELFVPVCQAIQHAHQKGIIHRDVKPSNVLVTLYDGKPVPKVIDFGVAKAIEQRLTERTLFTQIGQVVGTVEYMSPEQAELNALDIDTRSDIYSLGVLLYELLTGSTPLEKQKLRNAALAEMLRMIREEEPPRPSTRLSGSGDRLTSISAQRKTEPAKLAKLVRGELDWIVMKALEKDRGRRYETANGFARDLQRYLADEPVEACPPSAAYKLRKFARKNRRLLVTAGAFVLLLLTLAASAGWVLNDWAARRAETEWAVTAALEESTSWQQQRRLPEALSAARRADGLVRGGTADEGLRRRVAARRADLELLEALENARLEGAAVSKEGGFDESRADASYSDAFRAAGLDVEGLPPEEAAEQLRRTTVTAELAAALDDWAMSRQWARGDRTWQHLLAVARAAEPEGPAVRVREALWGMERKALIDVAASEETRDLLPSTLHGLASALGWGQASGPALALLRNAQRRYPDDFWINELLGAALSNSQPPLSEEAIRYYTAAVSLRPGSPGAHLNLGVALSDQGQLDEAIAENREALRLKKDYAKAHVNLGLDLSRKGDVDAAIREYQVALQINPKLIEAHDNLGNALDEKGDVDGAIREYQAAIQINPKFASAHNNLGFALQKKGDVDGAIREYQVALQINPKLIQARFNLGVALGKKGDVDGAIRELQAAIEINPKDPRAHFNLGVALQKKGDVDGAIREYQAAIQINPALPEAHCNLGAALSRQGRHKEAEAEYREAISLKPDDPWRYEKLGDTLMDQGQQQKAAAAFSEAIKLQPEQGWFWVQRGCAYAEAGQWEKASAEFVSATHCKEPHFGAWYCRAMLCLRDGNLAGYRTICTDMLQRFGVPGASTCALTPNSGADPKQLVSLAKSAVALSKDHFSVNLLGEALYRAGRFEEAIGRLNEATALTPDPRISDVVYTWFFMAMAHHRLQHVDEARHWLDKGIRVMEEELKRPAEPDVDSVKRTGTIPPNWYRKLMLHLLRREAEELIQGPRTKSGK
jgi:tetratricopeptide (TPR) repeat protein